METAQVPKILRFPWEFAHPWISIYPVKQFNPGKPFLFKYPIFRTIILILGNIIPSIQSFPSSSEQLGPMVLVEPKNSFPNFPIGRPKRNFKLCPLLHQVPSGVLPPRILLSPFKGGVPINFKWPGEFLTGGSKHGGPQKIQVPLIKTKAFLFKLCIGATLGEELILPLSLFFPSSGRNWGNARNMYRGGQRRLCPPRR